MYTRHATRGEPHKTQQALSTRGGAGKLAELGGTGISRSPVGMPRSRCRVCVARAQALADYLLVRLGVVQLIEFRGIA